NLVAVPYQRRADQERLLSQQREDARFREVSRVQPSVAKPPGVAVEQRLHPMLPGEPVQLARRRGLLREIDEVDANPPLFEETHRLLGRLTLRGPEDLNVHQPSSFNVEARAAHLPQPAGILPRRARGSAAASAR